MYLFIFESLGTSELILIGIVALIFLGPRRMPEIARKIGKVMADLRSTANDFKSTWEKEVDLEEEVKALRIDNILDEEPEDKTVPRENSILADAEQGQLEVPAIKSINKEDFEALTGVREDPTVGTNGHREPTEEAEADEPDLLSDKRNWL